MVATPPAYQSDGNAENWTFDVFLLNVAVDCGDEPALVVEHHIQFRQKVVVPQVNFVEVADPAVLAEPVVVLVVDIELLTCQIQVQFLSSVIGVARIQVQFQVLLLQHLEVSQFSLVAAGTEQLLVLDLLDTEDLMFWLLQSYFLTWPFY